MAARVKLSTDPLYEQVRDLIAHRIASGQWQAGAMLPNELELARELGVSSGTVRKALEVLERERLLRRQQGRGTFVADHTSEELAARFSNIRDKTGRRMSGTMELLAQTTGAATPDEQRHLQLEPGETVVRTSRRRRNGTGIFMHEDACLAASRFPGLADTEAGNYRISSLAQNHGVHLGRASEYVMLEGASAHAAGLLDVEEGTPLLKLERTVFTIEGLPVEWRVGLCHLREGTSYVGEMS
jgi:GntR family transcriptional regulator